MLYSIVKCLVRLGLLVFFRAIIFDNKKLLQQSGPLLLACNHPNSFLDALIIGSHFKKPVHFLARGDAFKNPLAKKILTALKVIPIYRLSEGKDHLALNDTTFERCTDILKNKGIVLIFSEGLCLNQWKLRQLKKGTARIALNAWKQPAIANVFSILPVSLNYSSFNRFRKNVVIGFGKLITRDEIPVQKPEGEQIVEINKHIFSHLHSKLLIEEDDKNIVPFLLSNALSITKETAEIIPDLKRKQADLKEHFLRDFAQLAGTKKAALTAVSFVINLLLVAILFIPALTGLILNLPLYLPLKKFIKRKTKETVFYHSALFGALIILYPFYAFIISLLLAVVFSKIIFLTSIFVMPFFAVIFLFWQNCLEAVINYCKLSTRTKKAITS